MCSVGANFGSDLQVAFYDRRCSDFAIDIQGTSSVDAVFAAKVIHTMMSWASPEASVSDDESDMQFNCWRTNCRQLDGGPTYHRRIAEESFSNHVIAKIIGNVDKGHDDVSLANLVVFDQRLCKTFNELMNAEDQALAKRLLTNLRAVRHIIDPTDIPNAAFYEKLFGVKADPTLSKCIASQRTILARLLLSISFMIAH